MESRESLSTVQSGGAISANANASRRPGDDRDDVCELLTVDEVAALLKVTKSWVYEHTRSRGTPRTERLPHIKLGKYVRFDARAVRAFLLKQSRSR